MNVVKLARKGLPPFAINFISYFNDHAEPDIPVEDAVRFFSKADDVESLRAAITEYFGPRCGEDWSSYLRSEEDGICGCCEAWMAFDRFTGLTVYPAVVIDGL